VGYWPKDEHNLASDGRNPLAAMVVRVWNPGRVNLVVFDVDGVPHSRTSVYLRQPEDTLPEGSYAEWMPHQKALAEKAEQLDTEPVVRK
jgi:hypothetical protein